MEVEICYHGFCASLPQTKHSFNAICVTFDRLTKSAHLLVVKTTNSMKKLVEFYIWEIVQLHGILISVISDWDPYSTFRYWVSFQESFGASLSFSMIFYSRTDGQIEKSFKLLRTC